jgi:hypothetical protein
VRVHREPAYAHVSQWIADGPAIPPKSSTRSVAASYPNA